MRVILSAFKGRLKSEVMEIPPSALYEFKLAFVEPPRLHSSGPGDLSISMPEPRIKVGRFEPTDTTEDGVQVYELTDIN